jgi:hypothetical protein
VKRNGSIVKRAQPQRLREPTDVPLDDGPRDGTEHWREIEGIPFCHWDRWLLRLALTEADGLRGMARQFRKRGAKDGRRASAEALQAQALNLDERLAGLGLRPTDVLDQVEQTSKWLHDKAFRRVWHASSIRETCAMRQTPRAVLRERALRGNWNRFTVSPAPFASELAAILGNDRYDYRTTGVVVGLLHTASRRMLLAARADPDRLAVHRAVLTVAIDAMEQVDDSHAEMAEFFRTHERPYRELIRARAESRELWRDLLDLVIWEDYGLFDGIDDFLRELPEAYADIAIRELASIIAELRRAGLEYQLEKACGLRSAVVAVANELIADDV